MTQLVEQPTIDFDSGHDLSVVRSSSMSGSMLDPFSPSRTVPPTKKVLELILKVQQGCNIQDTYTKVSCTYVHLHSTIQKQNEEDSSNCKSI